jgi:hypothetical protein
MKLVNNYAKAGNMLSSCFLSLFCKFSMKYYYIVLSNTVYALRIKKNLRRRGLVDLDSKGNREALTIKENLFIEPCEFGNLDRKLTIEVLERIIILLLC